MSRILLVVLTLTLALASTARGDDAGAPLDGGIADLAKAPPPVLALPAQGLQPLPVVPPAPQPVAPAAAAEGDKRWWSPLLTAGATLGGVALLLLIQHYAPGADPCGSLPPVK